MRSNNFEVNQSKRKKGRDLTQSYYMYKSPYIHRQIQRETRQHKSATKIFDDITIADRLRSFGGAIATKLVWTKQLTIPPPPHSSQQLCYRGHEEAGSFLQLADISICIVSESKDATKYLV